MTENHLQIRLIGDGICTIFVTVLTPLLTALSDPFNRGFFCMDVSIQYPFKEDNTRKSPLIIYFFLMPALFVALFEALNYLFVYHEVNKTLFVNIFDQVVPFLFSMSLSLVFVNVLKLLIGRLAPNFIDICRPDVNCSLPINVYTYITNYTCILGEKNKEKIMNGRQSFPSEYANIVSHSLVYIALFIHVKVRWKGLLLIKYIFQVILFTIAVGLCISNVTENLHHWSDVFAGLLIGSCFAIGSAFYLTDLYKKNPKRE